MRAALHRARRDHIGAIVVLVAIVFAAVYAGAGSADDNLPAPGWALTATAPTTNLVDGQLVTLNLKANTAVSVNELDIRECRFGATYAQDADFLPNGGNCPPIAVSTSADSFVSRSASLGLAVLAETPDGASVPYLVGEGVAAWNDPAGKATLTCDPTHPCALVAKLSVGSQTIFQSFKLTFADGDPLAACGGAAPGVLSSGGSDEISDLWAGWTRDDCARTKKGAPSLAAFTDENGALTQFSQGNTDIAYTGAGYDKTVGLAAPTTRPSVAIPLAVNASVIAAGGGQHQLINGNPLGDKVRYPDGSLELTAGEVGAMLGGGISWISRFDKPYQGDILARNPVLQGILYSPASGVYAPSLTLASTYYMTSYLSTIAPTDFVRPTVAPPAPHGPSPSLALANPPFDEINLFTGRPTLQKTMFPAAISVDDGPVWAMTDLASARALNLTPVALQSGGSFVAPTAASMYAAVADMKPDANGVLIPNPGVVAQATPAAGATAPYPLTYLLYAIVPTEPLVNQTSCTLRTASQALLTQWLGYVTGAGQQNLPVGMEPLPAALAAQAKAAIAKVGTAKVTGSCAARLNDRNKQPTTTTVAPTTTTTIPSTLGTIPTPASIGDLGGSSGSGGTGSSSGATVTPPVTVVTTPPSGKAGTTGNTKAAETSVKIPPFAGHRTAGALGGVVALLGIALITSLAAWITAGGEFGGGGSAEAAAPSSPNSPGSPAAAFDLRRIASLVVLWAVVGFTGAALVLFQLGPMLQQRDQRALLTSYRVTIDHAAAEADTPIGLGGDATSTAAPEVGTPVGIVEIGALKTQDVVVEGVQSGQTSRGPGHVPGTAGLGQPGNSVVVARRNAFGGSFGRIGSLHIGDRITVTTTQGQSVYEVKSVQHVHIVSTPSSNDAPTNVAAGSSNTPGSVRLTRATVTSGSTTAAAPTTQKISIDDLYGPSADNRLTLVTSGSRAPWSDSSATEVVAKLLGEPYAPTTQGTRSDTQTGLHGDGGAWPAVILALLGFGAVLAGSVLLYRRMRFRTAYVLSIAPLVALMVIMGEAIVRLLPAWS